jgi:hypothetical protein
MGWFHRHVSSCLTQLFGSLILFGLEKKGHLVNGLEMEPAMVRALNKRGAFEPC